MKNGKPIALVSAGAAGIGQAIALRLAADGFCVVASDVDAEGLAATKSQAQDKGRIETVVADATTEEGAQESVDAAKFVFGGLTTLVNVVGGSRPGRTILETSLDEWDRWVRFNLTSAFLMSRAAIPVIASCGGGSVINITSGAAVTGMAKNPAYVAAKGGMIALTKALAIDHAEQGVRANAVAPGPILTPLMRRNRTQREIDYMAGMTLAGRIGEPADIAAAVAFLASDEASFINGELINVTGGIRRAI